MTTTNAISDMLSTDIELNKFTRQVKIIKNTKGNGGFIPLLCCLSIITKAVVIARYIGRNGIYDGTCLLADIITKVDSMHGNNFACLKATGRTARIRNTNLNIIGGNSVEFQVDNKPNNSI